MNSNDALKQAILQTVNAIPAGSLSSYGRIAKAVGYPSHSRYVGTVLKSLPKDSRVPWHRVVNSQGKSSFPENSAAFNEQLRRLENEGVNYLNGKFNLKMYGWP